jgi:hypothetical protein
MDGSLARFDAWLTSRGRSASTAKVYRSLVRGFLRRAERMQVLLSSLDSLRSEALAHESTLSSNSRSMFRSALRAFLAFVTEERGLPPSELTIAFPDRRQARALGISAHPMAPFLREFFSAPRLPMKWSERLHWGDVRAVRDDRTGAPTGIARIEFRPAHIQFDIPLVLAQQMSLWAGGGKPAAAELPFIPSEPLSKLPMPAARIKRLAGIQVDRTLTTFPRFLLRLGDRAR